AIVRFGTNTQKSTEPAWQDVGANVLRMDTLYDATFHRWLKSEENVLTIAIHLQRISNEYPLDRIINALRWLVSSWRVESTAVIVRYVTADWAAPQNPPQPSSSPFRSDINRTAVSLLSDPGILSGEARRGVLVRELTKDWTSQQIAQLVSILAVNLWCERPHLEAFIRTLVSDWDFCRLSSFFSYISNQLCLDYRVKVTMLQQAARRNASRLSLKRQRNAEKPAVAVVSTAKSKADADPDNNNNDDDDGDSNKRLRTDAPATTEEPSEAVSMQVLSATTELPSPSSVEPESTTISATATHSAATDASSSTITASPPTSSSSSFLSMAEHVPSAASASSSSSHPSAHISPNSATQPANAATCISDSGGAPLPLSLRAVQAGRMPAPLMQVPGGVAEATTTPSTPAVASSPLSSQPTAPPSAGCCANEQLQTSASTTDLTSIPYNTPLHGAVQGSRQLQLQHHRRHLGGAAAAAAGSASTGRRTRSRNNTGSVVTSASTASLVSPASCGGDQPTSSLLVRRPLTPQTGNSLFGVHADGFRHQSPDSPTLHLDHRYGRRYPQPLTPSRSSTTLSMDTGIVSGAASSAADAEMASVVAASASTSTSTGGGGSSSASLVRQSLRHHAASVSIAAAEARQVLLAGSGSGNTSSQSQQLQHQQPSETEEQQQQDFRGRTSSESELGQFDGPASTHLSLPLPSDSAANAATVCGGGRTSTAAHYDVLGIVIESEQHHFTESSV
ncbi:hypothetical protein EV175_002177, partial [Coemansia sp. RSA 1933]